MGKLAGKFVGSPAEVMQCERAKLTRFLCSSTQDKQPPTPPPTKNESKPQVPTHQASNQNESSHSNTTLQPIADVRTTPNLAVKFQEREQVVEVEKQQTVGINQPPVGDTQNPPEIANNPSQSSPQHVEILQESYTQSPQSSERASAQGINARKNENAPLELGNPVVGLTVELPSTGDVTNFSAPANETASVIEKAITIEMQAKDDSSDEKINGSKNTKELDLNKKEEKKKVKKQMREMRKREEKERRRAARANQENTEIPIEKIETPVCGAEAGFGGLGVNATLVGRLREIGLEDPFPVQQSAIPPAIGWRDVLCAAATGSGKTLAYLLPLVQRLEFRKSKYDVSRIPRALIVSPSRELASQITRELGTLSKLRTVKLHGGVPYFEQNERLSQPTDIVVGTLGRISEHLERGTLNLSAVEVVVVDEADVLTDLQSRPTLERLIKATPKNRQLLMYSATISDLVREVANAYLRNPVDVDLGSSTGVQVPEEITHEAILVKGEHAQRQTVLDLMVMHRPRHAMLFMDTRREVDTWANWLSSRGLTVHALHAELDQAARGRVLSGFTTARGSLLVATDVAARGLHISDVDLVIQRPPTQLTPEPYIHRAGRTGRAGRQGLSVLLSDDTPPTTEYIRKMQAVLPIQFVRLPTKETIAAGALNAAIRSLGEVPPSVVDSALVLARNLLRTPNSERIVAAALAQLAGLDRIR